LLSNRSAEQSNYNKSNELKQDLKNSYSLTVSINRDCVSRTREDSLKNRTDEIEHIEDNESNRLSKTAKYNDFTEYLWTFFILWNSK